MGRRLILAAAVAALSMASGAATAAPEEIQVYMDEMGAPGEVGLDIHNNYVFEGPATPDYPGAQTPRHTYRFTPEFAYGLTPNLELGLYILSTHDSHGNFAVDGEKLRLKFIAPKPQAQSWYWGANLEIGRVEHHLDLNPWNGELKGIFGFRKGRWIFATNTNLDFVVSGPAAHPVTLDQATKLAYQVKDNLAIGVESYNDFGSFGHFGGVQSHELYATIDTSWRGWELNLGVGKGLTREGDQWVAKFIVGVPLQRPGRE